MGTEHLLLGLLSVHEGVAAQVLANLGVTLEAAREELLRMVGAGAHGGQVSLEGRRPGASIAISREAFALFQAADPEAAALPSATIRPVHLLLAMLGDTKSEAGRILREAGLDIDDVRKRIRGAGDERSPDSHH